jgi:Zinc finger, C3HC4 type (RING finger)
MAMETEELVDSVTCPICKDRYETIHEHTKSMDAAHENKLPIQSAVCSHSMCFTCLEWYIATSLNGRRVKSVKKCPLCRKDKAFTMNGEVNFALCDLADLAKEQEQATATESPSVKPNPLDASPSKASAVAEKEVGAVVGGGTQTLGKRPPTPAAQKRKASSAGRPAQRPKISHKPCASKKKAWVPSRAEAAGATLSADRPVRNRYKSRTITDEWNADHQLKLASQEMVADWGVLTHDSPNCVARYAEEADVEPARPSGDVAVSVAEVSLHNSNGFREASAQLEALTPVTSFKTVKVVPGLEASVQGLARSTATLAALSSSNSESECAKPAASAVERQARRPADHEARDSMEDSSHESASVTFDGLSSSMSVSASIRQLKPAAALFVTSTVGDDPNAAFSTRHPHPPTYGGDASRHCSMDDDDDQSVTEVDGPSMATSSVSSPSRPLARLPAPRAVSRTQSSLGIFAARSQPAARRLIDFFHVCPIQSDESVDAPNPEPTLRPETPVSAKRPHSQAKPSIREQSPPVLQVSAATVKSIASLQPGLSSHPSDESTVAQGFDEEKSPPKCAATQAFALPSQNTSCLEPTRPLTPSTEPSILRPLVSAKPSFDPSKVSQPNESPMVTTPVAWSRSPQMSLRCSFPPEPQAVGTTAAPAGERATGVAGSPPIADFKLPSETQISMRLPPSSQPSPMEQSSPTIMTHESTKTSEFNAANSPNITWSPPNPPLLGPTSSADTSLDPTRIDLQPTSDRSSTALELEESLIVAAATSEPQLSPLDGLSPERAPSQTMLVAVELLKLKGARTVPLEEVVEERTETHDVSRVTISLQMKSQPTPQRSSVPSPSDLPLLSQREPPDTVPQQKSSPSLQVPPRPPSSPSSLSTNSLDRARSPTVEEAAPSRSSPPAPPFRLRHSVSLRPPSPTQSMPPSKLQQLPGQDLPPPLTVSSGGEEVSEVCRRQEVSNRADEEVASISDASRSSGKRCRLSPSSDMDLLDGKNCKLSDDDVSVIDLTGEDSFDFSDVSVIDLTGNDDDDDDDDE